MDLGSRIAAWRTWKGWTQSQLADEAGVSRASMCQYEGAGKYQTDPSQENLSAIVAALGITMARFYGRVPKPRKRAA
jgi:transcriptional regulator with XRE-family HTH domain